MHAFSRAWRQLVVVAVSMVASFAIGFVLVGWWPSSEANAWTAVGSIATVAVAVASIIALVGLSLVAAQTETHRRQSRVQFGPYLRVDFAPDSTDGTWSPPAGVDERFRFGWDEFNPHTEKPATPLDQWTADEGVDLCVWITNKQTAPGGTAVNILLTMEIKVGDHEDATPFEYELAVHYLEPCRQIRYTLATLDPDIPYLRGEVTRVSYLDAHEQPLTFAYGAASFEWDGQRLDNHRKSWSDPR